MTDFARIGSCHAGEHAHQNQKTPRTPTPHRTTYNQPVRPLTGGASPTKTAGSPYRRTRALWSRTNLSPDSPTTTRQFVSSNRQSREDDMRCNPSTERASFFVQSFAASYCDLPLTLSQVRPDQEGDIFGQDNISGVFPQRNNAEKPQRFDAGDAKRKEACDDLWMRRNAQVAVRACRLSREEVGDCPNWPSMHWERCSATDRQSAVGLCIR